MLEKICGVPVLGVVPVFNNIVIEEEDSVELERKAHSIAADKVNVAVVLLRHISNFTDFNTLERDERVNLFYTSNTADIEKADIIILPGTKATLDDLYELRRNGAAQAITRAHRNGTTIIGICGGYQMLGQTVKDPHAVEGSIPQLPGLGLLDTTTTMLPEKTTRQADFIFNGTPCKGYEIHNLLRGAPQGRTGSRHDSLRQTLHWNLHARLPRQPCRDRTLHSAAGKEPCRRHPPHKHRRVQEPTVRPARRPRKETR